VTVRPRVRPTDFAERPSLRTGGHITIARPRRAFIHPDVSISAHMLCSKWRMSKFRHLSIVPRKTRGTATSSFDSVAAAIQPGRATDHLPRSYRVAGQLIRVSHGLGPRHEYILAIIEHANRRIRILGTTAHPTAGSVAQAIKNLVMDLEDAGYRTRYLVRDQDGKFPTVIDAILGDAGIPTVLCGVSAPENERENGHYQRLTGPALQG